MKPSAAAVSTGLNTAGAGEAVNQAGDSFQGLNTGLRKGERLAID